MSSLEGTGWEDGARPPRPRPLQSVFAVVVVAGCIATYGYYAFRGAAARATRAATPPPNREELEPEAESGIESLRAAVVEDLEAWLDELQPAFTRALEDPSAPSGGLLRWDEAGASLLPRPGSASRVPGVVPGDSRYTRVRSDGGREGVEIDARRVLTSTLHRLGRDNGTADYWYEIRGDLGDGGEVEVCYRMER